MIPVFLGIALIILVWVAVKKKKSDEMQSQNLNDFLAREYEANHSRVKDISHLDYITIPVASLPLIDKESSGLPACGNTSSNHEDGHRLSDILRSAVPLGKEELAKAELLEISDTIRDLSGKKIVNLTGISNTELKLAYGTANLNELTQYDANYTVLIRSLYQAGKIYHDLGDDISAEKMLSFAVQCKTDISANYTLLAEIYKDLNKTGDIEKLIAAAMELKSLSKQKIITSLRSYL